MPPMAQMMAVCLEGMWEAWHGEGTQEGWGKGKVKVGHRAGRLRACSS